MGSRGLFLVFLVLVASACSDSGGDEPHSMPETTSSNNFGSGSGETTTGGTTTGEPAGTTLVELPTQYAAAYCGWLYRCCPSEQLAHMAEAPVAFTGNNEEECRTNMAALLTLIVPSFTESESEGRLVYDPLLAESCIEQLSISCPRLDQICPRVARPLVMRGGACSEDAQCVDSLCIGDTDEVDGTCGSLSELGGPCLSDNDCASDECSGDVCVDKAALGETCFSDDSCASRYCDFSTSQCSEAPYSDACEP